MVHLRLATFAAMACLLLEPLYLTEAFQLSNFEKRAMAYTGSHRRTTIVSSSSTSDPQDLAAKIMADRTTKLKLAEPALISFPIMMAIASYNLHDKTSSSFHDCADFISSLAWDGDQDTLELVKPALGGPVVTSIAILFGTLVATTISTLIERNSKIHFLLISNVEMVRQVQLLVNSFPEPYRDEGRTILDDYIAELFYCFQINNVTIETLRGNIHPEKFLLMLNRLRKDENVGSAAVGEASGIMLQILNNRGDLVSALATQLPNFHYANLCTLGTSICLVFLIMTDGVEAPQLSFAWSLLVATFSMMAAVIYDLGSPLAGVLRVIYMTNTDFDGVQEYAKGIRIDE